MLGKVHRAHMSMTHWSQDNKHDTLWFSTGKQYKFQKHVDFALN